MHTHRNPAPGGAYAHRLILLVVLAAGICGQYQASASDAAPPVLRKSAARTPQAPGESIYYYNGDMRVDLYVVFDELVVRLPAGEEDAAKRAETLRTQIPGVTLSPTEERNVFCVRLPQAASSKADWRRTAATLSAAGYMVEAVAYPPTASERKAAQQIITNRLSLKLNGVLPIEQLAAQHKLRIVEQVSYSPDTYILETDAGPTAALEAANQVYEDGAAAFATPLIRSRRTLKIIPSDPLFPSQWHLLNTGPPQVTNGTAGNDVNIVDAWDVVTGSGVNLLITDDGLEESHPDLAANVRADLSYDYYSNDDNPAPGPSDFHGTAVAGVAGAVANNTPTPIGVVGSAFDASLIGVRLVAGPTTDSQEASAMQHLVSAPEANRAWINSNSWGPADSGSALETFGPLMRAAVEAGVQSGRGGLGVIYVWAAGNGRDMYDNVNFDGMASSRYTIAVGASGANGIYSWYSEPGASMLVNCPSSDDYNGITTTDRVGTVGYSSGDYTSAFGGTSSATPLAAGIIALMLERNPNLTWRDVQHILVDTAFKNDPSDPGWAQNGSGRLFNHSYGFGRIDAEAAVNAAATWTNVPALNPPLTASLTTPEAIPDNNPTGITQVLNISSAGEIFTEHVEVTVDITHTYRGDLAIILTSPSGMQSYIATPRDFDSGYNFSNWTFTSVAHWGEDPDGTWTLNVIDTWQQDTGTLNSWTLQIHGYDSTPPSPTQPQVSNVAISPTSPFSADDLMVTYTYFDPNGDPEVSTEFHWYLNGVLQTAYNDANPLPAAATVPGQTWHVEVRASDGTEWSTWVPSSPVTVVNRPPVLEPVDNQEVEITTVLEIQLSATDPDGDLLAYSATVSGSAVGYSIDPLTGLFTWDTTGNSPGAYTATFTVTDVTAAPLQDSKSIIVTLIPFCPTPDAPASIEASDGEFTDRIRISYTPVEEVESYWVYRNTTTDAASAELIAVWENTTLDDFSIEPAPTVFSCAGVTTYSRGPTYYYWVSAYNGCKWSTKTGSDSGYAGPPDKRAR